MSHIFQKHQAEEKKHEDAKPQAKQRKDVQIRNAELIKGDKYLINLKYIDNLYICQNL